MATKAGRMRTIKPAGTRLRGWPHGAPCRTASDRELCANDARWIGLCGVLMAHGRVCVETQGQCPAHTAVLSGEPLLSELAGLLDELREAGCSSHELADLLVQSRGEGGTAQIADTIREHLAWLRGERGGHGV